MADGLTPKRLGMAGGGFGERSATVSGRLIFVLGLGCCWLYISDAISLPVEKLLGFVADDALFYPQIARHLVAGHGSTFDGINPTTGYHPGWMLIVTLLASICTDRVELLRACLVACFALHVAASAVLIVVFRRVSGPAWGWLAGSLWLVNRGPLSLSRTGMESSLYVFALCLSILAFLKVHGVGQPAEAENPEQPSIRSLALFGLALGFVFLSRTEGAILAIVAICYLSARGVIRRYSWRRSQRDAFIVGASALAAALPWLLYSYAVTGSVLQDSGRMKMLWAADKNSAVALADRLGSAASFLGWNWYALPLDIIFFLPKAATLFAAIAVCAGVIVLPYLWRRESSALSGLTIVLSATMIATGAIYGLWYTDYQLWYLAQPMLFLYVIVLGWCGAAACRLTYSPSALPRALITMALVVLAAMPAIKFWASAPPPYPWQPDVYRSQAQFESIIPRDATIGCFNYAGISAYFSNRPVINLDGLVNHNALRHYASHSIDRYIRESPIQYIADDEASIRRARRFFSSQLHMSPIASLPLSGLAPDRRWLWRLER